MDRLIEWLPRTSRQRARRPALDRARRLPARQHDLPSDRAAHRRRARLGALDARPSAGRLQLPLHGAGTSPTPFRGIGGLDLAALGIPTEQEYVRRTASAPVAPIRRGDGRLELLPRLQPVPHRRHPAGHRQAGRGWHRIERAGAPVGRPARGRWRKWAGGCARRRPDLDDSRPKHLPRRQHGLRVFGPQQGAAGASCSASWTSTSTRTRKRYEAEIDANTKAGKRWTPLQTIEELKPKARAQGLWNLFLPPTAAARARSKAAASSACRTATTRRSPRSWAACRWSPEVFNCSAPDTGNMETIERYGSDEHKKRWLQPLLDGKIRSAPSP